MTVRQFRQTGMAYLIQDAYWNSLPHQTRINAVQEFNRVYSLPQKSKCMTLHGVREENIPVQLDFVDAVIQVFAESNMAILKLNTNISYQSTQVLQKLPGQTLGSITVSLPKKMDVGVTYTIKRMSMGVASAPSPVCITESVIAMNNLLGWWRYFTKGDRQNTRHKHKLFGKPLYAINNLHWIQNAPQEWQKWLGMSLGRLLAHEVWHQLWSQGSSVNEKKVGTPHPNKSYDGIEEEGGGHSWFKNDPTVKFGSAGRSWVLNQLVQLDKAQGPGRPIPIKRRK